MGFRTLTTSLFPVSSLQNHKREEYISAVLNYAVCGHLLWFHDVERSSVCVTVLLSFVNKEVDLANSQAE